MGQVEVATEKFTVALSEVVSGITEAQAEVAAAFGSLLGQLGKDVAKDRQTVSQLAQEVAGLKTAVVEETRKALDAAADVTREAKAAQELHENAVAALDAKFAPLEKALTGVVQSISDNAQAAAASYSQANGALSGLASRVLVLEGQVQLLMGRSAEKDAEKASTKASK